MDQQTKTTEMDDATAAAPPTKSPASGLSGAADYRYVSARTPTLSATSAPVKLLLMLILLVVGVGLYVHLTLRPIIPFYIGPVAAFYLRYVAIALAAAGALWLLVTIGMLLARGPLWRRLPFTHGNVYCPDCGTSSRMDRYSNGAGCRQCGSRRVYCVHCQAAVDVSHFVDGAGCPHCGSRHFAAGL